MLVIFGARRLEDIGSGLGRGVKNFRNEVGGADAGPAPSGQAQEHDPRAERQE